MRARRRVASARPARLLAAGLAAVWVALGAGCATVPSAEVTVFHEWNERLEARRFAFADPRPDSLEERAYREAVARAFESIGFVHDPDAPLLMTVRVSTREVVRESVELAPRGYLGFGWGSGGYGSIALGLGTPWYPWWPPPYWGPGYWDPAWVPVARSRSVYETRLEVSLRERRDGATPVVYEATAVTESLERRVPEAVRILAEAMVKDFPGMHGVVRRVELAPR